MKFTKEHMQLLQHNYGVVYEGGPMLAMDADQAIMATTANAGVLAQYVNWVDPQIINVLFTPMRATKIAPETKKGDWTTLTAQFPVVESVGTVKGYGDFDDGAQSGTNFNWENRQSFHYQTFTQAGEREIAMAGAGKIDLVNQLNKSSFLLMNKFQNASYFYGIDGLVNYGLLNDPDLPPAVTAKVKAAGGTGWEKATPKEIYDDFQMMFKQMVSQLGGNVEKDAAMTFACSPESMVWIGNMNEVFGNSAENMIKKSYPTLKFVSAPEYTTDTGEMGQLYVDEVDGVKTAETSFTEKMRAHAVVVGASSFKQKKSGGTWGAIIRVPAAVVTILGV